MNIIIHGSTGRMGRKLQELLAGNAAHTMVAAVSPEEDVLKTLNDYQGPADLIIDFSFHGAVYDLMDYAEAKRLPVVVATTGHTAEEKARIAEAAKIIPVFYSGNMSVGVALLVRLAKLTAQTFPNAEIEIIETHHDQKLDAPSGTALMIADGIKSVKPEATYNLGRSGQAKRTKEEIGIHAIRIGNVVGVHEVIVSTGTQTITLKHEAHDRMLFAEGAVAAGEYLVGQNAGLYNMETMLG